MRTCFGLAALLVTGQLACGEAAVVSSDSRPAERVAEEPMSVEEPTSVEESMADDWGLPFTPREIEDALALAVDRDHARAVVAQMEAGVETYGAGNTNFADGTLLLLAALSEELAERVVSYAPEMADEVKWLRQRLDGDSGTPE